MIFSLFTPSAEHELKMSVCEMKYDEEAGRFDIFFYLFQDDLKETLTGDPNAVRLDTAAVAKYISTHFEVRMNEKTTAITFQSIEERKDQVRVRFTSETCSLAGQSGLLVTNRLLIDTFRKQTNMTYLILPGRGKLTKLFNAGMTQAKFSF